MTYQFFHEGEVAVQKANGIDTDGYEQASIQMMQPEMNPQERELFERLTFSAAGSVDGAGRPWASPLLSSGEQLFTPTGDTSISIAPQTRRGDPLAENVAANGELGVLFFETATRRRAKSIGSATIAADGSLRYEMRRLFGLCPKYIFKRTHEPDANPSGGDHSYGTELDELDVAQLQGSDTIFLASSSPHGIDATHRGGRPGFVEVRNRSTIGIPDYLGNGMFNTLGNLTLDERLGLTDVDLGSGRTIHITGRARFWDNDVPDPLPQRTVQLDIDEVRLSWAPVGAWTDVGPSRYSPEV